MCVGEEALVHNDHCLTGMYVQLSDWLVELMQKLWVTWQNLRHDCV